MIPSHFAREERRLRERLRDQDPERKWKKRVARAKRNGEKIKPVCEREKKPKPVVTDRIIGVDGEGQDTPDGGHIYTYLAAVDEHGVLVSEAYNPNGLTHAQCCEMLLAIPKQSLKVGFMFSYDVTKICEALPHVLLYLLMRPNTRDAKSCKACKHVYVANAAQADEVGEEGAEDAGEVLTSGEIRERVTGCPDCGCQEGRTFTRPVKFEGRKYGFFNGSLTVGEDARKRGGKNRATKIWDVFRFFGCSFVEALKAWKIGTEEQIARIYAMKNKRGAFADEDDDAIKAYCKEECHLLAQMMRKVISSHEEVGIPLERYEGAGSTATALLKKFEVGKFRGPRAQEMDPELARAIFSAFFGGRFENSVVGRVTEECFQRFTEIPDEDKGLHSDDISSAYPYALTFLPCLACGTWRHEKHATRAMIEAADLAVAKYAVAYVPPKSRRHIAWAPLPFRDEKGSISYGTNFSGWAWKPEVLPALDGWPDLVSLTGEAWIFDVPEACKRDHKPFGFLPEVYRNRVKWGKEGAGIVLKLGPNATYGKCAQGIGEDPPFQSWTWAGMTTATCRGQILRAITSARDPWHVLGIATDGIIAAERLRLPAPTDTMTGGHLPCAVDKENPRGILETPKPLGGWEHKRIPEGIFLAKPGLYYRLNAELKDVRARGVGRREVYNERDRLEAGFAAWDRTDMKFAVTMKSRRFYGAKHSIAARSRCGACNVSWAGIPEKGCPKCGRIGTQFGASAMLRTGGKHKGKVAYGTWDVRDVDVAFDPYPKRERKIPKWGSYARLQIRDLGGRESMPYRMGTTTPEGFAARVGQELALEQPDWDEEG